MPALHSLAHVDWEALKAQPHTPSPIAWTDQVLYYLMIDRFSDGQEATRSAYTPAGKNSAVPSEAAAHQWRAAGATYCGGTLQGVTSKLDYLYQLGITTIWLSPIVQQPVFDPRSYHGYGAQHFLTVEPRFGTLEDLQALVNAAHQRGMYVLLDIVLNHAGFVFEYDVPENSETQPGFNPTGVWPVKGWHDAQGNVTLPFGQLDLAKHSDAYPHGAIWPSELQALDTFHRRGCIQEWEHVDQYLHGDFKLLKSINLGTETGGQFVPSSALQVLTQVYQYWLGVADLDGFRIDAVKHMGIPATTYFSHQVRQYARTIGKDNLLLVGEIPGEQAHARQTLRTAGLNAALALLDYPDEVEHMVRGNGNPAKFFSFVSSLPADASDGWTSDTLITMYDDHDQIRKNFDKARLGSVDSNPDLAARRCFAAIALLATTLGTPCLYYGSEQAFDGQGNLDIYIREAMFGGAFAAFRSHTTHCFNQRHWTYQRTSELLKLRQHSVALRQGEQHLLEISGDGVSFGPPTPMGGTLQSIVPWMRQTEQQSLLCLYNSHDAVPLTAWVKLEPLVTSVSQHTVLFHSDDIRYHFSEGLLQVTLAPLAVAVLQVR